MDYPYHYSQRQSHMYPAVNYLPAEKENPVYKTLLLQAVMPTALSSAKAIRHVMPHKVGIILANGYRRIEQSCNNIGTDVPY